VVPQKNEKQKCTRSQKRRGAFLEPISKFAFEPRDVIFMAKREVEGEEYRDISSPNRYSQKSRSLRAGMEF